jgi:putative redox protein
LTSKIVASHLGGDRFAIDVRGHRIHIDQPVDNGGEDTAPAPTELFAASLAGCVAFYARRYLARHNLSSDGMAVEAEFSAGGKPNRITEITMHLTPPASLPAQRRDAFLAVASHCTLHNTLAHPPTVEVRLDLHNAR